METPLCGNLSHRRWRDELAPGDTLAPLELLSRTSVSLHHRSTPLRVCSLLAIPPPPRDPKALPGGVPENLSEDNLSTWADTVQDVATGMIVLQPGTDQIIFPHLVELLTLLESVSRVAFCCQCYLPGSACRCLETSSTASTASTTGPSWSEIADPTFGPNSAPLGEALDRRFHMDLHPCQAAPFGICLLRIPGTPWGTFGYSPTPPPCWESFFLESQLMAIRYGLTARRTLRLPQPMWTPPATQNRRRTQLPPPPPRTDSVSTTDQGQQTTAPDTGPEGQGTQRTGRARSRGRHHGPSRRRLVSHTPPYRLRDALVERLGGLPTGTRWPILRTTVVGVEKRLGLLHGSLLQAQLQE